MRNETTDSNIYCKGSVHHDALISPFFPNRADLAVRFGLSFKSSDFFVPRPRVLLGLVTVTGEERAIGDLAVVLRITVPRSGSKPRALT